MWLNLKCQDIFLRQYTVKGLTSQTRQAVWDQTGRCLGFPQVGASSLSCTLSNPVESFHLWFAPHGLYPSYHLKRRTDVCIYEYVGNAHRVFWVKCEHFQFHFLHYIKIMAIRKKNCSEKVYKRIGLFIHLLICSFNRWADSVILYLQKLLQAYLNKHTPSK